MSVYFHLFDKKGLRGLCLGQAGRRPDAEFDGPVVYLDSDRYLLPARLLQLLIDRFTAEAGPENVLVLPEYELFDGHDHLPPDASYVDFGSDIGPDLTIFLPELATDAGCEEIRRSGRRIGGWSEGTRA